MIAVPGGRRATAPFGHRSGLRTSSSTRSGCHARRTSTGPSPWRSALVSASCRIRYTASCAPAGRLGGGAGSTVTRRSTPDGRTWAYSASRSASVGCGPSPWLWRSWPEQQPDVGERRARRRRDGRRAPRCATAGSAAAAYRAPSACAITTASECATTSCMSRAMRTRSCSTTASASARSCASRFARARSAVRTSAPIVHASSRAKAAATSTATATAACAARAAARECRAEEQVDRDDEGAGQRRREARPSTRGASRTRRSRRARRRSRDPPPSAGVRAPSAGSAPAHASASAMSGDHRGPRAPR